MKHNFQLIFLDYFQISYQSNFFLNNAILHNKRVFWSEYINCIVKQFLKIKNLLKYCLKNKLTYINVYIKLKKIVLFCYS